MPNRVRTVELKNGSNKISQFYSCTERPNGKGSHYNDSGYHLRESFAFLSQLAEVVKLTHNHFLFVPFLWLV